MTVSPDPAAVFDTAFFRRWLTRATQVITEQADHLTDLDSAIGDADHGANLRRGFTSASATVYADPPATPGALLKAFGTHLTSTVGGASGPLYGTVLRRAGRALGEEEETVSPQLLAEALAAAVAGVRRLGDSGPGDKTMVDALSPAAEAFGAALAGGAQPVAALEAAARAAREGAEATIPMRARRGRASYLGERSIGHQDPGATSSALLITALYEATGPGLPDPAVGAAVEDRRGESGAGQAGSRETGAGEAGGGETRAGETAAGRAQAGEALGGRALAGAAAPPEAASQPEPAAEPAPEPAAEPRVGLVLVSHSRDLAVSAAELAKALVGTGDPAPVAPAGGVEDGGIGTSAVLIRDAVKRVDAGRGVVLVCDMGSAVLTVKALLAETGTDALPANVRIADAPFVEGAVAALVTASTGADLDAVLAATDDARTYRKL